jgi:cell division septum initiation protein DivIVA
MTEQASKLPRKPFGYDPTVVDQMMSDRDAMLSLAERRVRDAEAKVAQLEQQLLAQQQAVAELAERVAAAESAPQPPVPSPVAEPDGAEREEVPLTPQFVTDEISKVIAAAEESTSQILERAWVATRDQVLEADRLWREVQAEVVRFAAWRDEAEAVARSVKEAMDEARRRIEAVPQRMQEALAPVVESMVSVDAGVGRFTAASTLPLLLTPSGLEAARARAEAMGHGAEMGGSGSSVRHERSTDEPWQGGGPVESEWSGMTPSSGADAEWSGMTELDQPDWAGPRPSPPSESEHGTGTGTSPQDNALDEASQQLREFLGMPDEPRDQDYEAGHPWGA